MTTNYVTNDPLAAIYNESQWRISKVSPMYNLQRSEVKLKQYASKIRQTLVRTVAVNSSTEFTIVLSNLPYLKYCEEDPDGLMVTISLTLGNNKTEACYTALFLAWGRSVNIDGATHLPYMLDRGEQKIGAAVKGSLRTIFDCNINQFCFTQYQLLQFCFNFVENDTSRNTDPFTLSYKTPQVDFNNKLNLTFEVGDVHVLWNRIKDEVIKESERVNLVYAILQNQIYYMMMLDVTVFELCAVTLPKAEVKSNGVLKMKTPEIVNSVFTVLNEIIRMQESTGPSYEINQSED